MNNYKKALITEASTTYPAVIIRTNQLLEHKINNLIKQEALSMLPSGRYINANLINGASQFDITVNRNEVLSIRLENYFFPEKAANGVTIVKGISLNLMTGKKYKLRDLFKSNSNFQVLLNTIIKNQIDEQNIPLVEEFTGIKENQEFFLSEENLVIVFQKYELTPGAYGVLEFKIPYSQLTNLLDKNSPITKLI